MKWLLKAIVWNLVRAMFRHRQPHTNATFLRRGTLQTKPREQRPARWFWLAGYQRLLVKLGFGIGLPAALIWWFAHPELHAIVLLLTAVTTCTIAQWRGAVWWANRNHMNNVVEPLHRVLRRHIGDTAPEKAHDWLTVPRNYREDDTTGTVLELPPDLSWPPELKKSVTEAVSHKLGIGELDVMWALSGAEPRAVFKPVPQAPGAVTFRDVEAAIRQAPDSAPVLGLGKRAAVISADLEGDSPHILISAGSGGGKSVLAKLLIAQALNRGSRIIILDRKRISHRWAKDLPGVEYYRDTEQIHDVLVRLAKEGDRRNRLTDDSDDVDLGGRIFFVYEEINATAAKLRNYWQETRAKEDPKRSIAEEALSDLVNMGRQVQIHGIVIGQQVTARSLGGGEVRESFGVRCLARYTIQTWKMLCADVWPAPRKSTVRGRWQIVANGDATECQVAFLTDEEARALALTGTPCSAVPPPIYQANSPEATARSDSPSTGDLVGLRDCFGADYDRRRQQLRRDPAGPKPVHSVAHGADLYRRVDLLAWASLRDARVTS